MTRNHTRSWHIPALACGGNNRRPPVPRCGAPGFDGDRDRGSPRRQHRNWLVWLRPFLQNLVGSEVELELCLAVAAGQVTFVELGRMWRMDRRTARERWLELLSRVRQGWLASLSATAIQELLRTRRGIAVRPFTIQAIALPPTVRVLPGCERRYVGVPTAAELSAFCERVHPRLFERNTLLALYRDDENTTAAVVVPTSPVASTARDHYVLAA